MMQKNTHRRAMVAILAACAMVLGALTGTASPAAAALKHRCEVIGTPDSYGNHAVHCVDLDLNSHGFVGSNDIHCQNSANDIVECAGIHETPGTCANYLTACSYGPEGVCGARFGHSPCGARRVVNYAPSVFPEWCSEFWAITIGTSVVLPKSGKTVNGGLVGSHYKNC